MANRETSDRGSLFGEARDHIWVLCSVGRARSATGFLTPLLTLSRPSYQQTVVGGRWLRAGDTARGWPLVNERQPQLG